MVLLNTHHHDKEYKEIAMDAAIMYFMREYSVFVHNVIYIALIMCGFIALTGCIRFGIAIWRRKKGTYPPAASQMDDH
jgi:uncharacterized membrane protein (DUF373 family)